MIEYDFEYKINNRLCEIFIILCLVVIRVHSAHYFLDGKDFFYLSRKDLSAHASLFTKRVIIFKAVVCNHLFIW